MSGSYREALDVFLASPASEGWRDLGVFQDGTAAGAAALVDRDVEAGAVVAPDPARTFAALALTPLDKLRVVILGQDPYPTPGHANGLAFSYGGPPPLPKSLLNIYRELSQDLDVTLVRNGDLSDWARQGVLLLNTALTVRAGASQAGSHLRLGWGAVTDAVIAHVSATRPHVAFVLWGNPAQLKRALIDENRHLVIGSSHPSPLSAHRGFFGSKPFSHVNEWMVGKGEASVAWRGIIPPASHRR